MSLDKCVTWTVETRAIADLKPHPENPRQFTEKGLKDLENSIKSIGYAQHVNVNRDGTILSGHARIKKLQDLGETEIQVLVPDRVLTPKQEQEVLIRMNANAAGVWDDSLLRENFEMEELTDWGLDLPEVEELLPEPEGGDEIPEATAEIVSVPGDLYELNGHRVVCGDSTSPDDVEKLMRGEKADLGFNDPPYGMKKEKDGVTNDNLNFGDLLAFNRQWIPLQFTHIKDKGSWYCWGIDQPLMDIYSNILKPMVSDNTATFRNLITWDKGGGQGIRSESNRSYAPSDEKCLFVMCGVQEHSRNAEQYFSGWEPVRDYLLQSRLAMGWDVPTMKRIVGHSDLSRDHWTSKSQFSLPTRKVYDAMKAEADKRRVETGNDAFKEEYDELKKEFYSSRAFFDNTHDAMTTVWQFPRHTRDGEEGGHATPKPIPVCERAIKSSCPTGGLVVDFFGGSGSTLIACESTGRKCYTLELEPRWVDVIVRRYLNFCKKNKRAVEILRNGLKCADFEGAI